ncbi:hypothetical protein EDC96DRAFT_610360 [Choanephora cucurbitarum]|nr:hypothetical protein EDC96DRAFT_610360 [Choanephora cucurbitarum]
MRCSEETEHGQRTMSRQETYKRTDTTLIRRRFNNVNTTLTSSDNHYISEKVCESVIYQHLHQLLLSGRYNSQFSFSKSRKAVEELDIYTDTADSSDPSADPNVAFSDGASNDFVEFFKSFESV